jgi:galactose-1-phosphate uridylyltransferase
MWVPGISHKSVTDCPQGENRRNIRKYFDLVKRQAPHNQIPKPWFVRMFLNLTPGITQGACIVMAIHNDYHDVSAHDLPLSIWAAVVSCWKFCERIAQVKGLTVVPFINGGKRPESGQSITCFHAQVYMVPFVPSLFQQIARVRQELQESL